MAPRAPPNGPASARVPGCSSQNLQRPSPGAASAQGLAVRSNSLTARHRGVRHHNTCIDKRLRAREGVLKTLDQYTNWMLVRSCGSPPKRLHDPGSDIRDVAGTRLHEEAPRLTGLMVQVRQAAATSIIHSFRSTVTSINWHPRDPIAVGTLRQNRLTQRILDG
jgi:hypothetical protein